jgi:hypothetical protein
VAGVLRQCDFSVNSCPDHIPESESRLPGPDFQAPGTSAAPVSDQAW